MTPSFTFASRIRSSFCRPVAFVALLAFCFCAGTLTQVHAQVHVVINEVDADTPGSDTAEFVELYNTSNAQVSLDGLVLVFFNGSSDQSYNALDLDGHTIAANGYFVLGNAGVSNVTITFPANGLQNGADAVALYTGDATDFPNGTAPTQTNLIDALVYDTNDSDDAGLLTGLGQTTQFNEGENGNKDAHSNSRATDGTGTFVAQDATPGTSNTPPPSVVINEVDADTPGSDTAEFVELYNTSNVQVSLDGLVLVFFNGSSDQSYNALDLDGHTIAANGYFVVGNAGVANVTVTFANNGLQNGADAVALYTGDATDFPNGTAPTQTNLIDALVYDTNDSDDAGLLTGLGQTTQFNEGENGNKDAHSNSRATDGTGTFVARTATPGTTNTPPPNLFINEVDANTPGTDTAEFVELYNPTANAIDLTGLVLVLFNGSDDASYNAFDLDGHTIAAQDFFVIGNAAVPNVDFVINDNTLQNGADAVALFVGNNTDFPNDTPVTTTNLVDALTYDTNDADDAALLAGLNLTTQFNEDENGEEETESISRRPDGTTTIVTQTATPGVTNVLPAITVTETNGSTLVSEDGTTDQFSVVLSVNPATHVVLDLSSPSGVTLSATQLTFTPANGTTDQTITIRAIDDNDIHGNRSGPITIRVNDALSNDAFDNLPDVAVAVTIVDNDFPDLLLEHSNSTTRVAEAGTTDEISLRLAAIPPSDVVVDLTTSSDDITLSTSQLTFASFNATQPQTVTVSATQDDRIEGLESATVTATVNMALSNGTFSGVSATSLAVSITDDDEPGFTLTPSLSPLTVSEARTSTTVAAALTAQPESAVTLVLSTSDAGEATVSPATLSFTPDAWDQAQTLTITGVLDTEDDPDQSVTITAAVDVAASDPNFASVASQSLSVSVVSVNGIMAVDDVATTLEDTAIFMDVRANDFDPAQRPLTLAIVTPPAHGTAVVDNAGTPNDVSDDVIVYTPALNRTDAVSFTYSASANAQSATATVTVNITPVNDPPMAVDDAVTMDEDTTVEIHVLANDRDPERSPLTIELVSGISDGTLVFEDQGTARTNDDRFVFTPIINVTRPQTFTYRITDAQGLSDEATVTITVTNINDAPLVRPAITTIAPGTSVLIDALANDTDDDGDVLTMRLTTGSVITLGTAMIDDGGTPSDPNDDQIAYTPPGATWTGWDRVYYEVDDGNGGVTQGFEWIYVDPTQATALAQSEHVQLRTRSAGDLREQVFTPSREDPSLYERSTEIRDTLAYLAGASSELPGRLQMRKEQGDPSAHEQGVLSPEQRMVTGIVARAFANQHILYTPTGAFAVTLPQELLIHLTDADLLREGTYTRGIAQYKAATDTWELAVAMTRSSSTPTETVPEAAAVTIARLTEEPTQWQHHVVSLTALRWAESPSTLIWAAGRYLLQDDAGQHLALVVPEETPLIGQALPVGPLNVTGVFGQDTDVPELTIWYTNDVQAAATDEPALEVPSVYALEANYPNPFNPSTVIRFSVPEAVHVTLEVYNVLGERVAVVASQEYAAGRYEHRFDGTNLASGMYLYRMVAGDFVQVNRMILMK